ncbi:MAG TPA: transcription termination/antitermination NusG family protein [Verrucomicrobiae bacterium]|nr:transcription termination/antitermination NusG family protein [Verrucomicrobiae bacterium]
MKSPSLAEGLEFWYALFTKPHQEDRAVKNLVAWGIQTLAPKLKSRENKNALRPLFPGYIFARFNPGAMLDKIRFTRGIANVVSFGGKPAVVSDAIISAICRRIDSRSVVVEAPTLHPGDAVMIQTGPLHDLQGVFEEELPDQERIRILLTTVAYSAHVEISKYDVCSLAKGHVA